MSGSFQTVLFSTIVIVLESWGIKPPRLVFVWADAATEMSIERIERVFDEYKKLMKEVSKNMEALYGGTEPERLTPTKDQ